VKNLGFLAFVAVLGFAHEVNDTHELHESDSGCKNTLIINVKVNMSDIHEMPKNDFIDARNWLLYHGPKMRLSDLGSELLRLSELEESFLNEHGGVPNDVKIAKSLQEKKNPQQKYLLPLSMAAGAEIMRFRAHPGSIYSHAQMRLEQRNILPDEVQSLLRKNEVSLSNVDLKNETYGRLRLSARLVSDENSLFSNVDTVAIVDLRILKQGKSQIYVPELQVVTVFKDNWPLLRQSIQDELLPSLGLSNNLGRNLANFLISLDHKHLTANVESERYASDYENLVSLLRSPEKAQKAAEFYIKFVENYNPEGAALLRFYFLPPHS
jgi:hypothetical protein